MCHSGHRRHFHCRARQWHCIISICNNPLNVFPLSRLAPCNFYRKTVALRLVSLSSLAVYRHGSLNVNRSFNSRLPFRAHFRTLKALYSVRVLAHPPPSHYPKMTTTTCLEFASRTCNVVTEKTNKLFPLLVPPLTMSTVSRRIKKKEKHILVRDCQNSFSFGIN